MNLNHERIDNTAVIPCEGLIEQWLKNELTVHEVDTAYGVITVRENKTKTEINLCSILTKLIKEAATCKAYASDLFISWESVVEKLDDPYESLPFSEFFGFRENGVDHNPYIYTKLRDKATYGEHVYNSIYRLDVWTKNNDVFAKLSKANSNQEKYRGDRV